MWLEHLHRPVWDAEKFEVMLEIVRARASHDQEFRRAILQTHNSLIVENVKIPPNTEWGIGDRSGGNKMGKILMKLRRELVAELRLEGKNRKIGIKVPGGSLVWVMGDSIVASH